MILDPSQFSENDGTFYSADVVRAFSTKLDELVNDGIRFGMSATEIAEALGHAAKPVDGNVLALAAVLKHLIARLLERPTAYALLTRTKCELATELSGLTLVDANRTIDSLRPQAA